MMSGRDVVFAVRCDECGYVPFVPVAAPPGSRTLCRECTSRHMGSGESKVFGDPTSGDGAVWYAADTMRCARTGAPIAIIESAEEWFGRALGRSVPAFEFDGGESKVPEP